MNPLDLTELIAKLSRARDKIVAKDYEEAQDAIEYALSMLFVERRRRKNLDQES